MMRFLLALSLALMTAATEATERIPDEVGQHVTQRVESGRSIGLVVGVLDASGVEYFGRGRSWAGGPPVDENTLFEIGSITKVFTAAVLADMVQKGQVALEEPVGKLLPPSARVPSRGGREITLVDLATHRSGLPRLPDGFDPNDMQNPYADYSEAKLLAFLAKHELGRDIGSRYEYSNLGVGLLGYALARRAGVSYEALVIERIARPLGMADTRIELTPGQLPRLARGHAGGREVASWDFDALAGAGALRSTARDLLRFVAANLGLVQGDPVPALASMRSAKWETGVTDLSIAFGWHVWSKYGSTLFWHNGATGGYHGFCGYDLEKQLAVVVLANGSEDIDAIGLHLLQPQFELPVLRPIVAVPAAALDELVGFYELQPGVVLHITRDANQLQAQLTGQDKFPVFAASPLEFYYEVVDARLTFVRGASGKVDKLVLHQNGDQEARRLGDDYKPPKHVEVTVDAAILASYVGKYELAPGVLFDVQLQDNRLAVKLSEQPRFPVFAESPTRFFYKVVEAQISFVVDASGTVSGLILHQGGRDQPAKKIE